MKLPENKRNVPSLFICNDGTYVTTPKDWIEKRRPEIMEVLLNEEYGVRPDMSDLCVSFRVAEIREGMEIMGGRAIRKTVEVECVRKKRTFLFTFVLFIPRNASKPVPAFVEINNRGILTCDPKREILNHFYPAENIVMRGYACAAFRTQEIAPDYEEGFVTGFHRLYPEYVENRPDNMMGTISVWAWAASRIMDYLVRDSLIDEKRVAIVGHSRGGKTSLLTAAMDERFAMAISSCSGCSGDAISREKGGEQVSQITEVFPYWFCANYRRRWAHNVENMPFDQHFLTAAIAPRLIYVSTKTHDSWADPRSEWETLVQTDPVYQLFGIKGLEQWEWPDSENPLHEGRIGYHQKTGEHDMDDYDWDRYLDFADKHL